ncbi:hypothetical protein MMC25_002392 [Agyrium rufum]|nr:hypothetical protein [Agyrium rufum]
MEGRSDVKSDHGVNTEANRPAGLVRASNDSGIYVETIQLKRDNKFIADRSARENAWRDWPHQVRANWFRQDPSKGTMSTLQDNRQFQNQVTNPSMQTRPKFLMPHNFGQPHSQYPHFHHIRPSMVYDGQSNYQTRPSWFEDSQHLGYVASINPADHQDQGMRRHPSLFNLSDNNHTPSKWPDSEQDPFMRMDRTLDNHQPAVDWSSNTRHTTSSSTGFHLGRQEQIPPTLADAHSYYSTDVSAPTDHVLRQNVLYAQDTHPDAEWHLHAFPFERFQRPMWPQPRLIPNGASGRSLNGNMNERITTPALRKPRNRIYGVPRPHNDSTFAQEFRSLKIPGSRPRTQINKNSSRVLDNSNRLKASEYWVPSDEKFSLGFSDENPFLDDWHGKDQTNKTYKLSGDRVIAQPTVFSPTGAGPLFIPPGLPQEFVVDPYYLKAYSAIGLAGTDCRDRYNNYARQTLVNHVSRAGYVLPYFPGSSSSNGIAFQARPSTNPGDSTSLRRQALTEGGDVPSYGTAMDPQNLPFEIPAKLMSPHIWGVIRISNIPFTLTRTEVSAFLGRSAKTLPNTLGTAIHIIMDRSNGKTMDCYVEFLSVGEASKTVQHLRRMRETQGRSLKLQDRHVIVEESSQAQLMHALFFKARDVIWEGHLPVIHQDTAPFSSGFKGFLTREELIMMTKFAEHPNRHGLNSKNPNRTYECMISTLYKLPYYATDLFTLEHVHMLWTAFRAQLLSLRRQIEMPIIPAPGAELPPNRNLFGAYPYGGWEAATKSKDNALLRELLYAGLNVPFFSERQRWEMIESVGGKDGVWSGTVGLPAGVEGRDKSLEIRLSPLCPLWPFILVHRKKSIEEDVVDFYASIIAAAGPDSPLVQNERSISRHDHRHHTQCTGQESITNGGLSAASLLDSSGATRMRSSTIPLPRDMTTPFGNVSLTYPEGITKWSVEELATFEWGMLKETMELMLGDEMGHHPGAIRSGDAFQKHPMLTWRFTGKESG